MVLVHLQTVRALVIGMVCDCASFGYSDGVRALGIRMVCVTVRALVIGMVCDCASVGYWECVIKTPQTGPDCT